MPNLSWPTTILRDFLHVLASLLGQIDIDALVEVLLVEGLVEVLLVKVVHVAPVAHHPDKQLPAPHVIDHGVKLHFHPHAI